MVHCPKYRQDRSYLGIDIDYHVDRRCESLHDLVVSDAGRVVPKSTSNSILESRLIGEKQRVPKIITSLGMGAHCNI